MIVQMDTEMNALKRVLHCMSHRPTDHEAGRRLGTAVEKQDSKAMSDGPPSQTTVRVSYDVALRRAKTRGDKFRRVGLRSLPQD